jgi:hypothetical protein
MIRLNDNQRRALELLDEWSPEGGYMSNTFYVEHKCIPQPTAYKLEGMGLVDIRKEGISTERVYLTEAGKSCVLGIISARAHRAQYIFEGEEPVSYDTLKLLVRQSPTFAFDDGDTIEKASSHSDAELWSDVIQPAIQNGVIKMIYEPKE